MTHEQEGSRVAVADEGGRQPLSRTETRQGFQHNQEATGPCDPAMPRHFFGEPGSFFCRSHSSWNAFSRSAM
jgi:hypothetical protein